MKTPREMLLARHQAAQPKLDALRHAVVADVSGTGALASLSPTGAPACRTASGGACSTNDRRGRLSHYFEATCEFFRLPKPALAGLALVWGVILLLNLAAPEATPARMDTPATMARLPAATREELREQRRWLSELVGTPQDTDAEPPRFVPRPRGEAKPAYHYV